MTEKIRLGVLPLNMEYILPGGVLHVDLITEEEKAFINKLKENQESSFVLVLRQDIKDNEPIVGIYSSFISASPNEDGSLKVDIQLLSRAIVYDYTTEKDEFLVEICDLEMNLEEDKNRIYNIIKNKVMQYGISILDEVPVIKNLIAADVNKSMICDSIAANLTTVKVDIEKFLKETDFGKRLIMLAEYLDQAEQQLKLDSEVEAKVHKEISDEQKEYYLRKKIKCIQEELGEIDKVVIDADNLKEDIESSKMPESIKKHALKELKRYKSTNAASPESTMIRAYLDTMIELPWGKNTEDNMDINAVKAKLDETHFGLDKVKDRILDYLSVKLYTNKNPQTILCLAGAPGVGKTTLAKSIAEALGRKFVKQSMGGVKDEAEVRGHRRTYIGALPGRIINGLKEAGTNNPVFLLDEIDKIGSDYKGDPSASLLEVLDPAQNAHFMDHYLEVEYDLSDVMFICTANYLDQVPAPLLDRMELIELSSYTEVEKFSIAKNYALKKSLAKNGLEPEKFEITDEALKYVIRHYTREAGARQLERCMDSLVRKAIKKILAEKVDKVIIDVAMVGEMLGKQIYTKNELDKVDQVGVVNGLAYTSAGGETLQIEVAVYPGHGELKLTGKLGDVMQESAQAARSWIKAHHEQLGIDYKKFEDFDIHIHCPEGAVPKDGPSAGVTMTTAMVSALTEKPVRHDVAMTGEITLRGRVLPIGGLKEKSIAAYKADIKQVLIPADNVKDLEDIQEEVKSSLEFIPVNSIEEVLAKAIID